MVWFMGGRSPACFLEEDYMKEKNIEFVGIPYNLFRRENGAE